MDYPKKLFVSKNEVRTENEYFNAQEEIEDVVELGDPQEIAVYELKEVKTCFYKFTDESA